MQLCSVFLTGCMPANQVLLLNSVMYIYFSDIRRYIKKVRTLHLMEISNIKLFVNFNLKKKHFINHERQSSNYLQSLCNLFLILLK